MRAAAVTPLGPHATTQPRHYATTLLLLLALQGCGGKPAARADLQTGYRELEQKRYDEAAAAADRYLKKVPSGPGSAEAVYLQGRVQEARADAAGEAGRVAEARAQLTAAANTYLRVLALSPPPALQGLARAGLANAAFHLDDYDTAVREWGLALPLLTDATVKAWALYRVGVSQQRTGAFDAADLTFAQLQQAHPGTDAARAAGQRLGQRAFYVQVGVYRSPNNADREIARLRAAPLRLPASRGTEPTTGLQVVRVGPFGTYVDAKGAKTWLVGAYPDAIVVP